MRTPHRDRDPARSRGPARAAGVTGALLVVMIGTGCSGPAAGAPTAGTPAGSGAAAGGEAGRSAAQVLSDARAAAQAADSVHISGTLTRDASTDGAAATATIDLVLTSSGDGREQITGAGQNIDLIKVGPTLYVKGLSAPGATTGYQQLATQDPRATTLVAQLDMKTVFDQLIKSGDTTGTTGTATVAGQAAVTVTPTSGVGELYVADDAAHPYPLKVETTPPAPAASGASATGPAGALIFTDWNAHTAIHPPT